MNRVVVIVLILLAAGAALAVINRPPEKGRAGVVEDDHWRKTADGWQRNTNWFVTRQHDIPAPHPIVVASFQVLLSIFALLFWPARAMSGAKYGFGPAWRTLSPRFWSGGGKPNHHSGD